MKLFAKRFLLVLLSVVLLLSTSCSKSPKTELTESTNATVETLSTEPSATSELNISSYVGTWSEDGLSWETGGFLLDLSAENGILTAYLLLTGDAPSSKLAEVEEVFALSSIDNSKISANFENDNWGNSGTMTLEFLDKKILCTLSNVTYTGEGDFAMWGLYDCEVELVRNNNAHDDLSYTMDDYYELYPEEKPTEQPVYDTSKASGILASKGMTEQEFRNSCQPLSLSGSDNEILTMTNLREYPSSYTGQFFYISGDSYNNNNDSSGTYYNPKSIEIDYKGTDSDVIYYMIYPEYDWHEDVIIYDLRDDVYSPTITPGDYICPYLIFGGVATSNGTDYVCFFLISVDK